MLQHTAIYCNVLQRTATCCKCRHLQSVHTRRYRSFSRSVFIQICLFWHIYMLLQHVHIASLLGAVELLLWVFFHIDTPLLTYFRIYFAFDIFHSNLSTYFIYLFWRMSTTAACAHSGMTGRAQIRHHCGGAPAPTNLQRKTFFIFFWHFSQVFLALAICRCCCSIRTLRYLLSALYTFFCRSLFIQIHLCWNISSFTFLLTYYVRLFWHSSQVSFVICRRRRSMCTWHHR